MHDDADRFRPRDPSSVSEQSPPTPADAAPRSRQQRGAAGDDHAAPMRPSASQRPSQSQRYAPPQYGARHQYNDPRTGAARIGAAQSPTGRAPGYAPHPGGRYAPLPLEHRDAPLIHPAAAQMSSATRYGVPVYHAPVYALPPHPQRGLSITALVLGACSFLFAWTLVVVPILGIVFGIIALRREPAGKAMAIIGLVGSCLGLLWVLLFYVLPLFGVLGAVLVSMTV